MALATIPFIPDLIGMVQDCLNSITADGYSVHVKQGQTEVHFDHPGFCEKNQNENDVSQSKRTGSLHSEQPLEHGSNGA